MPLKNLAIITALVAFDCTPVGDPPPGFPIGPCAGGAACIDDDAVCLHVDDAAAATCTIECVELADCTLALQPWPAPFGSDVACSAGLCIVRCAVDADCPGAMECFAGVCAWGEP